MNENLRTFLGCLGKTAIVLIVLAAVGLGLIAGMCGWFR
jgi:type IV secretory pathway VirB2 component (pilin)